MASILTPIMISDGNGTIAIQQLRDIVSASMESIHTLTTIPKNTNTIAIETISNDGNHSKAGTLRYETMPEDNSIQFIETHNASLR